MAMKNFESFSIAATGVSITTTISTSAGGTVPVDSSGNRPRFVRVASNGTAFVRLRVGATTAVTTDAMVSAGQRPLILSVGGATHYAVIDNGASCLVNITPLEDS